MPGTIAVLSYALGAAAFLAFTVLLITAWRGRVQGGLLVAACVATVLWAGANAAYSEWRAPPFSALQLIELLRDVAWFVFLLRLVGYRAGSVSGASASMRLPAAVIFGISTALAALLLWNRFSIAPHAVGGPPVVKLVLLGHLALSVCGLALVEQLYRNTRPEYRWGIKFLCFGVGSLFAYDLYLYSHALLFGHLDVNLWSARGLVSAFAAPLIAIAAVRNPEWSVEIFVSRHVVFHTAALLGAGVYLMVMAAAGYYVRIYGGSWGGVAQAAFLSGAVLLLAVLLASGQLRSRTKVFFSKHFYKNKYDYREEWLRFTQRLSTKEPGEEPRANIIRAVAEIVESPSGAMWLRQSSGAFHPVAHWRAPLPESAGLSADASLVRFMEQRGWVVYLDEFRRDPARYPGLELPDSITAWSRGWILVPMMHGDVLLGLVLLNRSDVRHELNWEDSDLLKTVGRQCAGFLALMSATEALADARQFDAFNRLSAYVVHDLKNLVAQLSLVVSNARRHMHSPGFMEDAIETVGNATLKMNRLLVQLRKGRAEHGPALPIDLGEVLGQVVESRAGARPAPALEASDGACTVVAEPDRLAAVVEHLVQNAQEATADTGRVTVRLRCEPPWAVVEVEDTGKGMDARFIAERLFRPFDTTKGNAGMGVGVYESREFVTANGGRLDVSSRPGEGSVFRIWLPLADDGYARTPDGAEMAS